MVINLVASFLIIHGYIKIIFFFTCSTLAGIFSLDSYISAIQYLFESILNNIYRIYVQRNSQKNYSYEDPQLFFVRSINPEKVFGFMMVNDLPPTYPTLRNC